MTQAHSLREMSVRALPLAVAALLLLQGMPAARADPLVALGKVKAVGDDGVIEVKERQSLDVTAGAEAAFGSLSGTTLDAAPDGAVLVVLGRRMEEQTDPDTQMTVPPQIVQIQAIVVASAEGLYAAPKLAPRHEKARLKWLTGTLLKTPGGFRIQIGTEETNLQFGPTRPVLFAQKDPAARDVKKNALVLVRGDASPGAKRGRLAVSATSFLVVTKTAPADQLAVAIGR